MTTIKRDNEEERMARIEHILSRLAEGRADAARIQEKTRRALEALSATRERRARLVESMRERLNRKSRKKKPGTHKRSR